MSKARIAPSATVAVLHRHQREVGDIWDQNYARCSTRLDTLSPLQAVEELATEALRHAIALLPQSKPTCHTFIYDRINLEITCNLWERSEFASTRERWPRNREATFGHQAGRCAHDLILEFADDIKEAAANIDALEDIWGEAVNPRPSRLLDATYRRWLSTCEEEFPTPARWPLCDIRRDVALLELMFEDELSEMAGSQMVKVHAGRFPVIDGSIMIPAAVTSSPETFTPREEDIRILNALAEWKTRVAADKFETPGVGIRMRKERLPILENNGLVDRAEGPKSGWAITHAGREAVKIVRTKIGT